jgi:phage protein D
MPPKKQPTIESGGSRVTTRASNANKHPGTEAKKTLQVQNRRDPEVVKADKEKKKAAKEAKEEARLADAAQKEIAQQNLEACRARQAANLEHDDETFPQQLEQAKGESTLSSILSLTLFNRRQKRHTFQSRVIRCKQVCRRCR